MAETFDAPRVSVVVLSWNRRDDLRHCLDALATQTYRAREVVVVDNGSGDGSANMVHDDHPNVRLIRLESNLGFAAANNLAIRATDAPYVVTLNNDAIAEPGWLAALVAVADGDPTLGSVASKMVFQHDPSTINSCGIALDRAGIAWDLWGGYPADLADRPREVFGPCAGAALYRRTMLDDIGLFDEDFFAYLEDVDLAWRARLRGWRCVLAPDAVVRHAHSSTLGEGSPLKRYLLARNKVWTVAKCAPGARLWRDLPIAALYDVGAVTFAVARHRDWASLRGRLAGLARLPRALGKRAEIQRRRLVGSRSLEALYAPLAAPWDVPRRYRHLVGGPGLGGQGPGVGRQGPGASGRAGAGEALTIPRALIRRLILRVLGAALRSPPTAGTRVVNGGATPQRPTPHRLPPTARPRVVVLRPDHLGDVLLSRPAIQALLALGTPEGDRRVAVEPDRVAAAPRRGLDRSPPSVDVTVIAGPWGTGSLQGLPVRVVEFPFPGFTRRAKGGPLAPYAALLAFAARLRRERYDAALVLRPDHWWGALAAALAGIPIRVGHATPETSPFLTHRLSPNQTEHAAHASLRAATTLAEMLGLQALSEPDMTVRFDPSVEAAEVAEAWIASHVGARRPIVVVHPGAGASVKTWPSRRWATITRALQSEAAVVLTGGPADAELVAGIQILTVEPLPAATDLTWDQLAALYRCADVVVGMDSGPLHLAAAVGTPTVRVYGPSDPRIYGPAPDEPRPGKSSPVGRRLVPRRAAIVGRGAGGDNSLPYRRDRIDSVAMPRTTDPPAAATAVFQGGLPCVPCGNLVAPPCGYLQDPPCLASVDPAAVVAAVRAALRAPTPA